MYNCGKYLFCKFSCFCHVNPAQDFERWQSVICFLRLLGCMDLHLIQLLNFTFSSLCLGLTVTSFNNGSLHTLQLLQFWHSQCQDAQCPLCRHSSHVNACTDLLTQIIVISMYMLGLSLFRIIPLGSVFMEAFPFCWFVMPTGTAALFFGETCAPECIWMSEPWLGNALRCGSHRIHSTHTCWSERATLLYLAGS